MRKNLLYSFWAKAFAFFLAMAMVPLILASSCVYVLALNEGWFAREQYDFTSTSLCHETVSERRNVVFSYFSNFQDEPIPQPLYFSDISVPEYLSPEYSNYHFTLRMPDGTVIASTAQVGDRSVSPDVTLEYTIGGNKVICSLESYVASTLTVQDSIYWANELGQTAWTYHGAALQAAIASLVVLLVLVVYLARAAGRREGGVIAAGWQERIPFDLYLALDCAAILFITFILSDIGTWWDTVIVLSCLVASVPISALLLALWMTFCTRVKCGKWWRNTICYHALRLIARICRAIWHALAVLFWGLPLIWRTVALFIVIWGAAVLVSFAGSPLILLLSPLAFLLVCAVALQLRRLERVAAALAAGDLDAKVSTRYMFWDFRRSAEHLNAIGEGMNKAVEERLRSERLKTELITNVSHDIKTPLTSIINYIDLLGKEHSSKQQAEYLDVLARQSQKLKKLTEDLVEVSKASTGNIPVELSRRSVTELIEQVCGEYAERLGVAQLEVVTTLPKEELFARVDGTLMWRVLDNIFSNACKYAQRGTRFYIDAASDEKSVTLSFKNISRERLNISADELLERFVRGDSARSGEGSGLGLNIAQSLTALQHGTLALHVDGDLFKVELTLPKA